MSNDAELPAIACTLSAAEYRDRIAWIADLNRSALLGYRRDGRRIALNYHASYAARVRDFVGREQRCCPFLGFAVEFHGDVLTVEVEAPVEAAEAADALFDPYLAGRAVT